MPQVNVDEKQYDILEARAEEKGFESTEEYIRYLMEQVVEKIKKEKEQTTNYSDEEEEKVKERLRGLGYLD